MDLRLSATDRVRKSVLRYGSIHPWYLTITLHPVAECGFKWVCKTISPSSISPFPYTARTCVFVSLIQLHDCCASCLCALTYSCRHVCTDQVHLRRAVRSSAAPGPALCAAGSWAAPVAAASAAGRGAAAGQRAAVSCLYRIPPTTLGRHAPVHHLLQENGRGHGGR